MKKIFVVTVVVSLAFLITLASANPMAPKAKSGAASAQVNIGDFYIGPAIGFWHEIGFSLSAEKIMLKVEDWSGIIGFGAEVGYSSYREDYGGYYHHDWYWDYTYIPIFVFASYHYKMKDKRFDPYGRLGFGYVNVSWDWSGDDDWAGDGPSDSYMTFSAQAGIRYAVSDKICLRAAVGTPWVGSIGVDFKLN